MAAAWYILRMLEAFLWGAFGLIFGSFTNVLILRHDTEEGLSGRSACPNCRRTLDWYELFPVLSWVALLGKCRTCRHPISVQYPLVEILTAAAFIAIGLSLAPLFVRILGALLSMLLISIMVYDLYYTLIPDRWNIGVALMAFLIGALTFAHTSAETLLFLASGPLIAFPLFILWLLSGGRWMGFGDVKFALGIGWLLGILPGYVALFLAFVIGAAVGVFILLPLPYIARFIRGFTQHLVMITYRLCAKRNSSGILSPRMYSAKKGAGFTMKSEVPFGPFLIVGLCILWIPSLYAVDVTNLLVRFLSLS